MFFQLSGRQAVFLPVHVLPLHNVARINAAKRFTGFHNAARINAAIFFTGLHHAARIYAAKTFTGSTTLLG